MERYFRVHPSKRGTPTSTLPLPFLPCAVDRKGVSPGFSPFFFSLTGERRRSAPNDGVTPASGMQPVSFFPLFFFDDETRSGLPPALSSPEIRAITNPASLRCHTLSFIYSVVGVDLLLYGGFVTSLFFFSLSFFESTPGSRRAQPFISSLHAAAKGPNS